MGEEADFSAALRNDKQKTVRAPLECPHKLRVCGAPLFYGIPQVSLYSSDIIDLPCHRRKVIPVEIPYG